MISIFAVGSSGLAGSGLRPSRFAPATAPRRAAAVVAAEERPLKVAIAGGGVGGLTTALAMLKAGFDVTLYERTGQFARFGGPIQFASNALSTRKAGDEGVFERVMEKFTFTGTRRCGIKDGLRADGNFRMTDVADPKYIFDSSVPADWYLEFPLRQCADFFKLPYTGVINRPDLQETLIDECVKLKPDFAYAYFRLGFVMHEQEQQERQQEWPQQKAVATAVAAINCTWRSGLTAHLN